MDLKRRRGWAWAIFWLFVLLSWTFLVRYGLTAGHSSCEESGTCTLDAVVSVFTVLLIPLQVILFVYLRDRTVG